jgi:hypothetical protein
MKIWLSRLMSLALLALGVALFIVLIAPFFW